MATIFGIDAAQVIPLDGTGTEGTPLAVKLAGFSFNTESDSSDYSANNTIIDSRRYNKRVTGSAEIGEADTAVLAIVGDGAVTTTGTAPDQTLTYAEPNAASDDEISIAVRNLGGDGSVIERKVLAVKVTGGPGNDAGSGNFGGLTFDFTGRGDINDMLWQISQLKGTAATLTFA